MTKRLRKDYTRTRHWVFCCIKCNRFIGTNSPFKYENWAADLRNPNSSSHNDWGDYLFFNDVMEFHLRRCFPADYNYYSKRRQLTMDCRRFFVKSKRMKKLC